MQAECPSQAPTLFLHERGTALSRTPGLAFAIASPAINRRRNLSCGPPAAPSDGFLSASPAAGMYGAMGGRPTAAQRAEIASSRCDKRSSNLKK